MKLEAFDKFAAGECTFDAFARSTASFWSKEARVMRARHGKPASTCDEDVTQEMLLAAWRSVETYDAKRGALGAHMITIARYEATRWMRKQRGLSASVHRHEPETAPVFVHAMPEESVSAAQYEAFAVFELIRRMSRAMAPLDGAVLDVLCDAGDLDSAADALYADTEVRAAIAAQSKRAVWRRVRAVAAQAASMMGEADG